MIKSIKDNSPSTTENRSPANIIFSIATSSGTIKIVFAKIRKEEGKLLFDFFVKNEKGCVVPIPNFSQLIFIGCRYDGKLGPKIRTGGSMFFLREEGVLKKVFISGQIISISQ